MSILLSLRSVLQEKMVGLGRLELPTSPLSEVRPKDRQGL